MNVKNDRTNLGMTLPIRYKCPLSEYMDMVYSEFGSPSVTQPEDFSSIINACQDSILLTEDEDDSGLRVKITGVEGFSFKLIPLNISFHKFNGNCLFFIDSDPYIYSFTAKFNYEFGNESFFSIPNTILKRSSRKSRRIPCTGLAELYSKAMEPLNISGNLNDISINGVSVILDGKHHIERNTEYVVKLILDENEEVFCKVRVSRVEPFSLVSSKVLLGMEVLEEVIEGSDFYTILDYARRKRKEGLISKSGIIKTSPTNPRVNYDIDDFS